MNRIGILYTQISLEQDIPKNLEGEKFCTSVRIMKIVLFIISQENPNWKAKKKRGKEKPTKRI